MQNEYNFIPQKQNKDKQTYSALYAPLKEDVQNKSVPVWGRY